MVKITIMEELRQKKECLKLCKNSLIVSINDKKEYLEGEKLNKWKCETWVLDLRIDAINRYTQEIENHKNKIKELENKISLMLSKFNKDLKPITKGILLKLLSVKYNYFNNETLEFWECINKAIEENINFDLRYKTIEKNLLLFYNHDLKRWDLNG